MPEQYFRWDKVIEPNGTARLTVGCWFKPEGHTPDEVLEFIRDPDGPVRFTISWRSAEARFLEHKFKERSLTLRAKDTADEKFSLSRDTPYTVS